MSYMQNSERLKEPGRTFRWVDGELQKLGRVSKDNKHLINKYTHRYKTPFPIERGSETLLIEFLLGRNQPIIYELYALENGKRTLRKSFELEDFTYELKSLRTHLESTSLATLIIFPKPEKPTRLNLPLRR